MRHFPDGDGGVILDGGDRSTLTPAGNSVKDCDIHEIGRWVRTYTPGSTSVGWVTASQHNRFHDSPHFAIWLTATSIASSSTRSTLALETHNVGAFYLGRDYTERGNVVRYNYFHHLGRRGRAGGLGAGRLPR